jgi:hypothetical protein
MALAKSIHFPSRFIAFLALIRELSLETLIDRDGTRLKSLGWPIKSGIDPSGNFSKLRITSTYWATNTSISRISLFRWYAWGPYFGRRSEGRPRKQHKLPPSPQESSESIDRVANTGYLFRPKSVSTWAPSTR